MESQTDMSYDQKIAIVQAIRQAVPSFAHYQEINKRIIPFIQGELEAIKDETRMTSYVVWMEVSKKVWGNEYNIKVWGNGLMSNEAVHIRWNDREFPQWQEGLHHAMSVADMSDYKEREALEEDLIPALTQLDQQVRDHIHAARTMVAALPVPTTATARADSVLWSSASGKLREQFPLLFKTYVEE
jgi:hypothetical protein